MATALVVPRVGVGVILTRNEGQEILVGRRCVQTLKCILLTTVLRSLYNGVALLSMLQTS